MLFDVLCQRVADSDCVTQVDYDQLCDLVLFSMLLLLDYLVVDSYLRDVDCCDRASLFLDFPIKLINYFTG